MKSPYGSGDLAADLRQEHADRDKVQPGGKNVFIFVYGTLKEGYGNHNHYLARREGVEFVSYGNTKDEFQMLDGGFPVVVVHTLADAPKARVAGEVYTVPWDIVTHGLDGLEGYPDMYDRKEYEIELQDGSVLSAWMYTGTERYWPDNGRRQPVTPDALGFLNWRPAWQRNNAA